MPTCFLSAAAGSLKKCFLSRPHHTAQPKRALGPPVQIEVSDYVLCMPLLEMFGCDDGAHTY
jgi:hypothetical protein